MSTELSQAQLTPAERRQLNELLRSDVPALLRLAVSLVLVAMVALLPPLQTTFVIVLVIGVILVQIVPTSFALWRALGIALDLRAGSTAVTDGTLEKVGRSTSRYLYQIVFAGRKMRAIHAVVQKVETERRYRARHTRYSGIVLDAQPIAGKVRRKAVK